jgi:hypothetical protein
MTNPALSWCAPGGARRYVTTRAISWGIGAKGSPWRLIIPAGREFESSVPRFARWILSPDDPRFLRAALIHDHLLEAGFRPFFAAGEWYDAALSQGAPRALALIAALGVTLFTIARRAVKSPAGDPGGL